MATIVENHHVARYQYELHNQFTSEGISDNAILYLYATDKSLLAAIGFVPNDRTLAAPIEAPEGHVTMQMHTRNLGPIIDMLRNEKPVSFSWSPVTSVVRVSTQKEPVGEQELKRLFSWLYI